MDVSGSQQSFIKPHHNDLQAFLKTVLQPQDRGLSGLLRQQSAPDERPLELGQGPGRLRSRSSSKAKNRRTFRWSGPREHRVLGTAFYDAIFYSSTQMMQNVERGRRALIVFSDGEDNSSAHHMMEAIEAAQANDVLLFTIRYTEVRDGRLNARNKYGISVMERIARETGGADFDGTGKGLSNGFRQIDEQLRSSLRACLSHLQSGRRQDLPQDRDQAQTARPDRARENRLLRKVAEKSPRWWLGFGWPTLRFAGGSRRMWPRRYWNLRSL